MSGCKWTANRQHKHILSKSKTKGSVAEILFRLAALDSEQNLWKLLIRKRIHSSNNVSPLISLGQQGSSFVSYPSLHLASSKFGKGRTGFLFDPVWQHWLSDGPGADQCWTKPCCFRRVLKRTNERFLKQYLQLFTCTKTKLFFAYNEIFKFLRLLNVLQPASVLSASTELVLDLSMMSSTEERLGNLFFRVLFQRVRPQKHSRLEDGLRKFQIQRTLTANTSTKRYSTCSSSIWSSHRSRKNLQHKCFRPKQCNNPASRGAKCESAGCKSGHEEFRRFTS